MAVRQEITSTKNPVVKRFRDAARGEIDSEVVVDGFRLVWDVVRADIPIRAAAVSPRLLGAKSSHDLKSRLATLAEEFVECADRVLERMSSLETPQGVIAIVDRPSYTLDSLLSEEVVPLLAVAAGVRDPGNLGAIARTAEAAGASGMVVLKGSADPFRDKAVRGSSGSVLRLPTTRGVSADELVEFTASHGMQLVVAEGAAELDYTDHDWTAPTAVVLGAEGAGLPAELRDAATARVRIPIADAVESLNVAVAAGVLLFEAGRQRRGGSR